MLAAAAAASSGPKHLVIQAPNEELADYVRQIVIETSPRLKQLTGQTLGRVKVVVAGGEAGFRARARRLGGPLWAAGLAVPSQGLILVRPPSLLTDPSHFRQVVVHELTHLHLALALGRRRLPLWLEEGLAMYASGEGGWGRAQTMAGGVLRERLMPFSRLEKSFPESSQGAALAYAQSYYLVAHLLTTYGPDAMERILAAIAKNREVTTAVYEVTGKGLVALEEEFKQAMASRFSWLALLGATGVLWAVVAVIAGVGLVVRRRSQLRRLRAMDDEPEISGPEAGPGMRKWPPPGRRGDVLGGAGLNQPPDGTKKRPRP
jgi:hypothetical protein